MELTPQLVSWLAMPTVLFLFELTIRVLSPGAYSKSRWTYGVLLLAMSPVFLWSGLAAYSPFVPTLACALGALFFALRALERENIRDVVLFSALFSVSIFLQPVQAALLALPALALLLELWRRRQWAGLGASVGIFLVLTWVLHTWMSSFSGALGWQDWSVLHLFKNTFEHAAGARSYALPNMAYLLYPLAHPFFCLTLPALFFLFKKTDVHLYSKRVLALSLLLYLAFLGGLPQQDLSSLLPAYAVLLLLFFPAWDRFFAYGLYFFPRLAYALLGLTAFCQIFFLSQIVQQG